jgi:uncharacterized protein
MYREYKIRQLQKEREMVKANRKVWIAKHKNNIIDEELARVFTAYQTKLNQLSMSITRLKQGF